MQRTVLNIRYIKWRSGHRILPPAQKCRMKNTHIFRWYRWTINETILTDVILWQWFIRASTWHAWHSTKQTLIHRHRRVSKRWSWTFTRVWMMWNWNIIDVDVTPRSSASCGGALLITQLCDIQDQCSGDYESASFSAEVIREIIGHFRILTLMRKIISSEEREKGVPTDAVEEWAGIIESRTDRPDFLIKLTTALCGNSTISMPFTATTRSPTCSCPEWAAGDPSIIFPTNLVNTNCVHEENPSHLTPTIFYNASLIMCKHFDNNTTPMSLEAGYRFFLWKVFILIFLLSL